MACWANDLARVPLTPMSSTVLCASPASAPGCSRSMRAPALRARGRARLARRDAVVEAEGDFYLLIWAWDDFAAAERPRTDDAGLRLSLERERAVLARERPRLHGGRGGRDVHEAARPAGTLKLSTLFGSTCSPTHRTSAAARCRSRGRAATLGTSSVSRSAMLWRGARAKLSLGNVKTRRRKLLPRRGTSRTRHLVRPGAISFTHILRPSPCGRRSSWRSASASSCRCPCTRRSCPSSRASGSPRSRLQLHVASFVAGTLSAVTSATRASSEEARARPRRGGAMLRARARARARAFVT